jgi:hypothetical protein
MNKKREDIREAAPKTRASAGRYHCLAMCPRTPYGEALCRNGDRVLFDREYEHLCVLHPDGTVERVQGRAPDVISERLFWTDGRQQPERSAATRRRLQDVFAEWGLL